jgi:hypothetical protein
MVYITWVTPWFERGGSSGAPTSGQLEYVLFDLADIFKIRSWGGGGRGGQQVGPA